MKTNAILLKLLGVTTKISLSLGIIVSIVFSAGEAKGQYWSLIVQPPVQIFPWGSTNALIQFAVTNTQFMAVSVTGENPSGQRLNGPSGVGMLPDGYSISNEAGFDSAFQQILTFAANQAMTNTSVPIDKSLPLFVDGGSGNFYYPPPSYGDLDFSLHNVSFQLIFTNGNWILPDLSGIQLNLNSQLLFYVPGLEWGRLEVYDSTNLAVPFIVVDSREPDPYWDNPTNEVNTNFGFFHIATPYVASGNNGSYRMKVSMFTSAGGFLIVDGTGYQIQETPLVPSIAILQGTVKVTVTGGDPGRVFFIQKSTDLQNWSQVGGLCTVGTNANWYTLLPPQVINTTDFYRTVTADRIPTQW